MKIRKALLLLILALALLCAAGAALAEGCPHWGAIYTDNGDGTHHGVCPDCGADLGTDTHVADCRNQSVCDDCGAPCTDARLRHYETAYKIDVYSHMSYCMGCGHEFGWYEHQTWSGDPEGVCSICGANIVGECDHSSVTYRPASFDDKYHQKYCEVCGVWLNSTDEHTGSCENPDVCYYCGAPNVGGKIAHWRGETAYDHDYCWNVCSKCGEATGKQMHYAYCLDPTHCVYCGQPVWRDMVYHHYDYANMEWNETQHWTTCRDCGEKIVEDHDVSCRYPGECRECGSPVTGAVNNHMIGDVVVGSDAVNHWLYCNYCEEYAQGPEPHYTNPGDPAGVCSYCGIPYSAFSLNSLTTDVSTAAVGQQITITANMSGAEQVLEMEYHVYNQLGQHISGWNGISGVYYYTATEPGAYTFRVYVRTAAGWVNVDSKPVTVTAAAKPLKVVALKASGTTAKVGDVLTFTTQFEGEGEIAWIEYHIYDTQGQHLTGYRGEGDGISGVYNYPTANTGAGKYTARVYLMAQDGTFTQVDSVQVTVTAGTRKAVALKPNSTTAKVGDTLVFTTQFEGDGPIAWIEYHIYDTYGNHLTGYRGEGSGISGVYNYPTVNTGAGKYTARVYLMAQDGTFTVVDSVQVTVE